MISFSRTPLLITFPTKILSFGLVFYTLFKFFRLKTTQFKAENWFLSFVLVVKSPFVYTCCCILCLFMLFMFLSCFFFFLFFFSEKIDIFDSEILWRSNIYVTHKKVSQQNRIA